MRDILDFLFALRCAVASAGSPVILIVVVREQVPAPANFLLSCIQSTLPAIIDCCEQLVLVVEVTGVERVVCVLELQRFALHQSFPPNGRSI